VTVETREILGRRLDPPVAALEAQADRFFNVE
jgi:hypothetical protein